MRLGILRSEEYGMLAKDMVKFDDIIIAIDTNIFYKAQVTACLLDSIAEIAYSDYLATPNWITIVVSLITIGELDNKANLLASDRILDTVNFQECRRASRGLQEFMEIESCVDLEGVTILLTGNISPEFDFSNTNNTVRDSKIRE